MKNKNFLIILTAVAIIFLFVGIVSASGHTTTDTSLIEENPNNQEALQETIDERQ